MLLNIVNAPGKITLYRGDFEKIDEFKVRKTHKHCLWGPGVYLTANKNVAETYRTKGQWKVRNPSPVTVYAFDKIEAMEKLLKSYISERRSDRRNSLIKNGSKDSSDARVEKLLKQEFEEKLANGSLIVKRNANKTPDGKFLFTLKDDSPMTHGWLTSFVFNESDLVRNTIQIDSVVLPEFVCEILKDPLCWKKEAAQKKFLANRNFKADKNLPVHPNLDHYRFIRKLQERGIVGYRHTGGIATGSSIRHQVFVIFDEDFVNQHKQESFK